MNTPRQRYQEDLQRDGFSRDPAQEHAVELLQDLYDRLIDRRRQLDGSRLARLFRSGWSRGGSRAPEVGLYLWGGVGRGKTYLMDTFFECLAFDQKISKSN